MTHLLNTLDWIYREQSCEFQITAVYVPSLKLTNDTVQTLPVKVQTDRHKNNTEFE